LGAHDEGVLLVRTGCVVVTGAASGMGAATALRLEAAERAVVRVDLAGGDVDADLGTDEGRLRVLDHVASYDIDGVATFAGVSGFGGRQGSTVISIDYFGTVRLLDGLRPALARRGGAAVAISSNTATTVPSVDDDLVGACLAGDEDRARAVADGVGGPAAYSAAKLAVARWVRRLAPTEAWAGSGVRLNAVSPGHIETALTAEMRQEPVALKVMERTPLPIGQPGRPEHVAALVALLLGDEGGFFVGSVLYVDGGTDALLRADDWPAARQRAT
jgi:NAD(P)-dependent dehydrogenase (short-subunit alcohol dehydrogenase family)